MRGIVKVASINLAIVVMALVTGELALGDWFGPEPMSSGDVHCYDERLHHNYCPSMMLRRFMASADGAATIDTYINKSSLAVASFRDIDSTTDVAKFDVINLGDSFMEAEELPFGQRLSQRMRAAGVKALQVGYTSWAPINMLNWLKANPPRKGSHVNLFVMTNDFMPNYTWANINYHTKLAVDPSPSDVRFKVRKKAPIDSSLWATLKRRSFVLSRGLPLLERLSGPKAGKTSQTKPLFNETAFASPSRDCADLRVQLARSIPIYTKDLLYFARSDKCWTKDVRAAVASGLADIRRIHDFLSSRNASLTVLLIPGGWSFEGENIEGKKLPGWWGIGKGALITQAPLAAHMADALGPIDFVDLEPVFRKMKRDAPGQYYFPLDGHWTAHAHKQLAKWLLQRRN